MNQTQIPMTYAGFSPRFAAIWLDLLFILPLVAFQFWGAGQSRLFTAYFFLPSLIFNCFYNIYLPRTYGGTPGKRVMKLRVACTDGGAIGYREAVLRFSPDLLLNLLAEIGIIIAATHMTDARYLSLSFLGRPQALIAIAPVWLQPVSIASNIWRWSELFVMLTNKKRRALHDFLAGTVVLHDNPGTPIQNPAAVSLP